MPFDIAIHDTVSVKVPDAARLGHPGVGHTQIEVSLPSRANVAVKASDGDLDLLVVKTADPGVRHFLDWLRLRVLGLSGHEAAQIHSSRKTLVRRMLGGSSIYVEVTALALPAEPQAADKLRSGGIDMTTSRYDIDNSDGIQFDLAGGERLNLEPDDGFYSMAWTTALPLTTIVPRLESFLRGDPHGELTVFADGEHRVYSDDSSSRLLDAMLSGPAKPAFWRLDTDDVTLTWEARDEAESTGQPGLLGLIADEFNGTEIQALLESTATPLIGAEAPDLVARCSEAAKRRHPLAAG